MLWPCKLSLGLLRLYTKQAMCHHRTGPLDKPWDLLWESCPSGMNPVILFLLLMALSGQVLSANQGQLSFQLYKAPPSGQFKVWLFF